MLDEAFEILGEIQAHGRLAVIVGGAVRDLELGRPLTDVDLATDMPLAELSSLFKTHAVGRSEQFDTVVISRGGRTFEISRFRRGGRSWKRLTAPRRRRTASRRCARTPHTGTSPSTRCCWGRTGASSTCRAGSTTCATASSARRVAGGALRRGSREDPARRAFRRLPRFHDRGGDRRGGRQGRAAPGNRRGGADRQGGGEDRRAAGRGPRRRRHADGSVRAARALLPEVANLQGLPQPIEWHPEGDAWEHTLAALRSSASADPAVNLAVLLHDVGKHPAHREVAGRHHYRGHESAGGGIVDAVARRLHLPQRMRAAIAFAVEHHLQAGGSPNCGDRKCSRSSPANTGRPCGLSRCATARRGGMEPPSLASKPPFARPKRMRRRRCSGGAGAPPISGTRVMELTGLSPGPLVGEIRRRVCEWAEDNRVEDRAQIEAEAVRLAREQRRGEHPADRLRSRRATPPGAKKRPAGGSRRAVSP